MIEYENLRRVEEPYFADFNRVCNETLESGWLLTIMQLKADMPYSMMIFTT